jgi:mycoredoxin
MTESQPRITIYIRPWCGGVMRVKRWFDQHDIAFQEIDITKDTNAARHVEELNGGYQSVPTLLLDGEHVATEPSTAELERLFADLAKT